VCGWVEMLWLDEGMDGCWCVGVFVVIAIVPLLVSCVAVAFHGIVRVVLGYDSIVPLS